MALGPGQRLARTVPSEFSAGLLREVLELVAELNPPDDLRVEVFRAAAAHAGQLTIEDGPVEVARNSGAFHNPR